ncbi:MAG TPA: SAM-dependent chlorinase/fluorinase [Rhodothermia bacterium]
MSRIITLTSDFGNRDAYVATMKGVILSIDPSVRLIDISHEIAAQDVMEAAFVLQNAAWHFPDGTVHLVVVDPGVGTGRNALAVELNGQFFVGADNGLFTLLTSSNGESWPGRAVLLDRPEYWYTREPSSTFHGRDIFAAVAAHLASGRRLDDVGTPTKNVMRLRWATPFADDKGLQGWIVQVDHYGNCITNISRGVYHTYDRKRSPKCYVGTTILEGLCSTYDEAIAGEPILLFGSSGYLEVAINRGNAARLLSIRKGDPINIVFSE